MRFIHKDSIDTLQAPSGTIFVHEFGYPWHAADRDQEMVGKRVITKCGAKILPEQKRDALFPEHLCKTCRELIGVINDRPRQDPRVDLNSGS